MKKPKWELFLELAKHDEHGFSRRVLVSEFTGRKYSRLRLGGGGGSWCRDDGPLGKRFNVYRDIDKGRIIAIELHGYNNNPTNRGVPQHIKKEIRQQRCVVLGTGNVEVDHKIGRIDRLKKPADTTVEDFQPLSKAANNAKRQHCKECKNTGKRFDAKRLGYSVSQVKGNDVYNNTCVGCYWHDPKFFIQQFQFKGRNR